jgi:hypothetical protein
MLSHRPGMTVKKGDASNVWRSKAKPCCRQRFFDPPETVA